MKASKFLLVGLWGLLGFATSANAALLSDNCTILSGCGPDFNITGLSVDYAYDGVSQGVLTVSGSTTDVSFLPDQLNPWPNASEMTGFLAGTNPDTSIPIDNATTSGNKDFLMTMTVDSSGNLQSGSISMDGKVQQYFSSLTNTNPDFLVAGPYTAAANGVNLDGALIAAGSTITAMGFLNKSLDFRAALDPSSVLSIAGLGSTGFGILGVDGLSTTSTLIEWDTSWTAASASLGIALPVPAALWLFLSGIGVLLSASKSRFNRS